MEQTNKYPSHSINQISKNTARILKGVKQHLASQENISENEDTLSIPNGIKLAEALSLGTFASVGMNMYKGAIKNEDYGRIWVRKTIEDPKTGNKEDWLVVYTNDEDEIIRQVASEKLQEMKKAASLEKTSSQKYSNEDLSGIQNYFQRRKVIREKDTNNEEEAELQALEDTANYFGTDVEEIEEIVKVAAQPDPKNIPIAPGIKSKDLKLNESGGAGTGTVTIEFTDTNKALKFYQEEVTPSGGEKEAPKEEEGVTPQEGNQPTPPPIQPQVQGPQVQPKASSLINLSNRKNEYVKEVIDFLGRKDVRGKISSDGQFYILDGGIGKMTVNQEESKNIAVERVKNIQNKLNEAGFNDVKVYVSSKYDYYLNGTHIYIKIPIKITGENLKASSLKKSSAEDTFGQQLWEDDIVKLEDGRRAKVVNVIGDIIDVIPVEVTKEIGLNPFPVDANSVTKWSNLKSTVSEFSDGVNGVKVIRYSKGDNRLSATPWELGLREALGKDVNYNYDKYSFINENGIEIPITIPLNIKVGEMFERSDTHGLVRFAGFIDHIAKDNEERDEFVITDNYFKKNNITPKKGLTITYRGKKAKLVEEASGYVNKENPGWWAYYIESKTSSQKTAVKDNEGLEELEAGEDNEDYNEDDAIDEAMNGDTEENEEEASIDIHIEAEPKCIDKMIDSIINGIDFDEDQLEGGKADNKEDEDFDEDQLEKGKEVEKEHTGDEDLAKEIAEDHLTEMDDYYDKLEDMENKGKKKEALLNPTSMTEKQAWKMINSISHRMYFEGSDDEIEELVTKAKNRRIPSIYIKSWLENEFGAASEGDIAYWMKPDKDNFNFDKYESLKISKIVEERSLNKSSTSSNLGVWVGSLSKRLQPDQLSQLHNILNQFLPEIDGRDYFEIVKGIDNLPPDQKRKLETTLKEVFNISPYASLKFSSNKLSFDDPYTTQDDFYSDQGSYDQYLNESNPINDENFSETGDTNDIGSKELSIGDPVKVVDPNSDQFGQEGTITDNLEFNSYRVTIGDGDYHLYGDEIEKIASKTAADISDEVPPVTWTTDESKSDRPDPGVQPLPPKPGLNNSPGDVLYDSNKEQQGQGKFQVTTDPTEKTVTVKFLDEEKALDQAINEGAGMQPSMQPNQQQTQFPQPGQGQPQKQFEDTNSQVGF